VFYFLYNYLYLRGKALLPSTCFNQRRDFLVIGLIFPSLLSPMPWIYNEAATCFYSPPLRVISGQYRITSLTNLSKLPHLEPHTLVLRKTKQRIGAIAVYAPTVLIDILPRSINSVRLNIREGGYYNILSITEGIWADKNRLTLLHHLKLSYSTITARLQPLELEFHNCVINLEIVELEPCQINLNISITFP
jgi:hypothetical protein